MKDRLKKLWENRTARILIVCVLALLLLLAVWKVFFPSASTVSSVYTPTERELRVNELLSSVEGIDRASVYLTEEEGKAVSAIVIYEGEDSIVVRMRILDIASAALNLDGNSIRIYPAARTD